MATLTTQFFTESRIAQIRRRRRIPGRPAPSKTEARQPGTAPIGQFQGSLPPPATAQPLHPGPYRCRAQFAEDEGLRHSLVRTCKLLSGFRRGELQEEEEEEECRLPGF